MFERPAFGRHLRVDVLPPDLVIAACDEETVVLRGRLLPLLAPWLDGTRTVAELAACLAGEATALDVRFGLSLLADEGLLEEGAGLGLDGEEAEPAAWADLARTFATPAVRAPLRVGQLPPLAIMSCGGVAVEPFARALQSAGLRLAQEADFLLVLSDDYLDPEAARIAERQRARRGACLLAKPVGPLLWIGPILPAAGAGCFRCLAHRLAQNRPSLELIEREGRPVQRPRPPRSESLDRLAAAAILDPLRRWLRGESPSELAGGLVTLDPRALVSRHHPFIALPHCPLCGSPPPAPDRALEPVQLRPLARTASCDGGYRREAPEATLARLARHVSPITGLVGRLRPHGVGPVEVFLAEHLFRSEADERAALAAGKYHKSAGKGLSDAQARASALSEALERHCGVFRGEALGGERRRRASLLTLGEEAIHPNRCMLYSPRQYAERERWNEPGLRYLWVPEEFDADREIDWSPLWSISERRVRYLPTAYCYYAYPLPEDHSFCFADSNGAAAGNCLEEAILQGFLELVERDAIALWWYHRLARPGIDLASFEDPFFPRLQAIYRELGRELHVLDLTHDLGIPACVAVSRSDGGEILLGFGAHLEARIAVARALTEVGQFLPGSLDGRERQVFSEPLTDTRFLEPDPALPARRAEAFPRHETVDLRHAVTHCVSLAAGLGLETLVLDQSRADVDLSVVKVFVPGLRHFWARLAPGRLYTVPQRLGWTSGPTVEEDLNSAHLLI